MASENITSVYTSRTRWPPSLLAHKHFKSEEMLAEQGLLYFALVFATVTKMCSHTLNFFITVMIIYISMSKSS